MSISYFLLGPFPLRLDITKDLERFMFDVERKNGDL